jgi:aminoglycoside 6'-N-acetyltransferase
MEDHQLVLRPASISDLPLLQYWDTQPHVIDSDPNDDWQWETELKLNPDWRKQLIAEINGRPVGFVQIIDPAREESRYWGDVPAGLRAIDIWIGEESDLGKGYGTEMMRLAVELCFTDAEVTSILVDPLESNVRSHKFYERMGFRFLRKQRFREDDCFVYELRRDDWFKL